MKNVIVVFAQNPIDIDAREEFLGLCEACELEIVRMFFQNVKEISHRTYIGSGKAAEIKEYMNENEVDGV